MQKYYFDINSLEKISFCPVCKMTERKFLYNFNPFYVYRCTACTAGYLAPRITEKRMKEFYADSSYFEGTAGYGYGNYASQESSLRLTFRHFLRILHRKGILLGELLEIGCGTGILLNEAGLYCHRRVGTEFCGNAAAKASGAADEIIVGGFDRIPSSYRFDVIIAVNVIEHVYNPVNFLQTARTFLKEKGKIILVMPDIDSLWHHLFRHRWPSFKIPEHILYFNRKSLQYIAHESALETSAFFLFTQIFPLSLILEKFSIRNVPDLFQRILLPVPATMLCVILTGRNS